MSGEAKILGWDVGGAHLKLARFGAKGALETARVVPCPLWRGLDELDRALDALKSEIPEGAVSAVTMTGELVDLWPDRATGVAALVERLDQRLAPVSFYAGSAGFLDAASAKARWTDVASANWRATAQALASRHEAGLMVDIGSTTADLIPFAGGAVTTRGSTDATRMAAEELVYLGAARTPLMAVAPRFPFDGAWITPMAEHFATSADVFRLTGDLPDGADLHPAADGGPKTVEASARRLLRMVGRDLNDQTGPQAGALADWLAEKMLQKLHDAAAIVLSRNRATLTGTSSADSPASFGSFTGTSTGTLFGAGVGRFLAVRLAERLGLLYRDVGAEWSDDANLAAAAADCAPAVAVASLLSVRRG